jgi:beta-glucosidase
MTEPSAPVFPEDFVWGVSSAAYQLEGAVSEDGRGESIWDRFCATPGSVRNGESGAVACDFYHRYREDIGLLSELGVDAFRFSISWPRILPSGRGEVNDRGLDFYDRLVDALLEAGIKPVAVLYHWDLPQALENEGGWTNRATAEAFADYSRVVGAHLGDRVEQWVTQLEPWVTAWLGYGFGVHAPGRRSEADAVAASHHLLLSHGRAVEVLRGVAPSAKVGIVLNLDHLWAATDRDDDHEALRWWDGTRSRWYLDPLFRGEYPADVLREWEQLMPAVEEGDLACIASPIDFLGVNNYTSSAIGTGAGDGERARQVPQPGAARTDMDWEIHPDGLREVLLRVNRDYGPGAVYITENGAAFPDVVDHEGHVLDPERQRYLEAHVDAAAGAVREGVPLKGYFVWALMDNFEWSFGYWKRFGLVHVDYPTQKRTPKASFRWYHDLIAAQRCSARERAAP